MLNELYVMKIDAKQELDNMNSSKEIDRFKKLIIVPDGLNIDSLLDGERYYLIGEKGAGKTAMLIYTALLAEEYFDAERCFIIFKEFSQEERIDYSGLAHVTRYDQESIEPCLDYEFVWWWIFHNAIADTILTSDKEIFQPNEALDTYLAAIKSIASNPRGDKRRMPIISKDGYVEVSLSVPISGALINLVGKVNFEKNPTDKQKVRFSTHIHELNRLFGNLDAGDSQLYVVVDEMNLSTKNTEEFERDVIMIRDLIVAIEHFNTISKNSHGNVRVIGSIRNEVINSVKAKGKEINKSVESYGIPIDWTKYAEDINHPLIKLLINYFKISDELNSKSPAKSAGAEYDRWVDYEIYGSPSEEIIRNFTLYRPRHVVRLLNLSKLHCGKSSKISTQTFNSIKKYYSRECWNEIIEELALSYNPKELELIKEWLTGMPWRTSYQDMQDKAEKVWIKDYIGKDLFARFDDLMRDLFKAGVIGNSYKKFGKPMHRWYFRGDETLLKTQDVLIHRIFSSVLSTVQPYN